jgi:hypothetical protein
MNNKFLKYFGRVLTIAFCVFLFSACKGNDEKSYNITIDNVSYIDIEIDSDTAKAGVDITIEYELTDGYELEYFLVNEKKIDGNKFVMPKYDVSISAQVKKALYEVNIKLNNDDFGTLMVSNVNDNQDLYFYGKSDYEFGDRLFIGVEPNPGYYLRSYSDSEEITLGRYITIDKDINIEVILEEGEACNYYGYNIAVHGDGDTNFYQEEGNVTSNIKYFPNKTYNSGTLSFAINNENSFSYFELSYKSTKKLVFDNKLNKEQIDSLFEDYTGGWIDVCERDTRTGTIYSTYDKSNLLVDSIPDTGEFEQSVFNEHNPAWLYSLNHELVGGETLMKSSNFVDDGENVYLFHVEDLDSNGSIEIYEYIIFTVGDELYYRLNTDKRIVRTPNMFFSNSTNFTSVVNGTTYTLTFIYCE